MQSMAELPQGWCTQLLLALWQYLAIKRCFLNDVSFVQTFLLT